MRTNAKWRSMTAAMELEKIKIDIEKARRELDGENECEETEEDKQAAFRHRYHDDPDGFAKDVLGITLTAKQSEILRALIQPPYRVIVKSANNCGKTITAAIACVWFFCTRDPSLTLITAETFPQVNDTVFKEIRRLYGSRPGLYPKAPHIETSPNHVMKGFTASGAVSFQGRRELSNFMVFEEANGIAPEFWEAVRYMMSGGFYFWLAMLNPTDQSAHVYIEELSGNWTVLTMSAFEHPNILAELGGDPPPIPPAVRLGQLKDNMATDGQYVAKDEVKPLDVDLWNPKTYGVDHFTSEQAAGIRQHFSANRRFWRPSPIGEARICGRYPTQSAYAVFSEAAFNLSESLRLSSLLGGIDSSDQIVVGCDVARFGDDDTTIHARRGRISLEHHTYHGQNTTETAGRLKEICKRLGQKYRVDPCSIRCNIDDSGVGGGVTDQNYEAAIPGVSPERWYNFVPITNACVAVESERFPNVRSELLFTLAEQMNEGRVDLSLLGGQNPESCKQLRNQALQILYKMDARGRRVVEPKADIKKRLGRSPDDLDAFALAYYSPLVLTTPTNPTMIDGGKSARDPFADRGTDRGAVRVGPLAARPGEDKW